MPPIVRKGHKILIRIPQEEGAATEEQRKVLWLGEVVKNDRKGVSFDWLTLHHKELKKGMDSSGEKGGRCSMREVLCRFEYEGTMVPKDLLDRLKVLSGLV